MRTLTIQRTKRFVACLGTMKVYVEDPAASELVIDGRPCRKLGTLKNGQTQSFEISEAAARIYVIADKLSKNYCNDFYELPAGEEDVFLSGRNHFNPGAGNPFYFDGVTDESVLRNRKKGIRTGVIVLVAALLVGAAIGFMLTSSLLDRANPETFSYQDMQITLTDQFSTVSVDGFDVCYSSGEAVVFALEEPFSMAEGLGEYTLEEYAELVIEGNGLPSSVSVQTQDGLTFFEYTATNSGDTYAYLAVVYKTDDAFWLVQFSTLADQVEEYRPTFLEWAKSAVFVNA